MSRSNAAAIRRRAGISEPPPAPAATTPPPTNVKAEPRKLTLPEVITIFDQRISKVEEQLKTSAQPVQAVSNISSSLDSSQLTEIISEFNHRFEILADEIANLKDTLLSLQTYTMDVNKMLLNERVRVLSDLGSNIQLTGGDNVDNISIFSLASESNQVTDSREPSSPTSVDMRTEVTKQSSTNI
jgi:hypothetical protein